MLEVYSDKSDAIIYTSCHTNPNVRFLHVGAMKPYVAIAIEPQHVPNGINFLNSKKDIYHKGEVYNQRISYRFHLIHGKNSKRSEDFSK